jgi:hypothetical protein
MIRQFFCFILLLALARSMAQDVPYRFHSAEPGEIGYFVGHDRSGDLYVRFRELPGGYLIHLQYGAEGVTEIACQAGDDCLFLTSSGDTLHLALAKERAALISAEFPATRAELERLRKMKVGAIVLHRGSQTQIWRIRKDRSEGLAQTVNAILDTPWRPK